MASLSRDASGRVAIQFIHPHDRKRRTIRAGKMSERDGEALKRKVEDLAAALGSGLAVGDETQLWLTRIGDGLRGKLAAVGLCERPRAGTLGAFLDDYITGRAGLKPKTIENLHRARRMLVDHFGADRALRSITPADGDLFRQALIRQDYAPATIGRSVLWARQFFRHALRARLIQENPFIDVEAPAQVNRKRQHFVTLEVAARVLEACPSAQWRLAFALARYGGLRCPSELLSLTWQDVDWERSRFLVHAPKTERHEGKEERWVPIFPELKPYLEEAFDRAEPGVVHVIDLRGRSDAYLHTGLTHIVRRAGLTTWPRLFHNLRASRETELMQTFPVHVVTAWMGHDALIAQKHYLQVTDDDFQRAAKGGAGALQKAVQQGTAPDRTEPQDPSEEQGECEVVRSGARCRESVPEAPGVNT
jgi:integrase